MSEGQNSDSQRDSGADKESERERNRSPGDSGSQKTGGSIPPGNVFLTGLMGCGKSTVGWHLSQISGLGYVDLDDWVERKAGMKVHEIFAQQGEQVFRDLERQALLYWSGARRYVISLGGGALVHQDSWAALRKSGVLVWINTPLAELARRLLAEGAQLANRPLLEDLVRIEDPEKKTKLLLERLGALLSQRQDRYREALVTVDNGYTTPDVTARCIKELLMENGYFGKGESRLTKFASRWKRWGAI